MATAAQRLAAFFSGGARMFGALGGAADRIARTINPGGSLGAPPGYGASNGPAPDAHIVGVTPWMGSGLGRSAEQAARALLTPDAYLGRVSYDAGPSATRFSSYPATDLSPAKIAGAQQEASAGWPHRWEEMIEQILSRDAHLSGIAQQRVDDVVKGTWRLVRATPDEVGAGVRSFCDEAVRGFDGFEDVQAWLLWSNAYCYTACEIVWRRDRLTFAGPRGERLGPVDVGVPARVVPGHPKHLPFYFPTT